jgi:spermidine synthase
LAAALNLSIAALVVLAVLVMRAARSAEATADEAVDPPAAAVRSFLDVALLAAFALSGAAAMVYENAWTRALTLVIGMSTYSFTVMLTTFLVGLGVGSLLYARWWGTREVGVAGFGLLQLFIALAALVTIPLFERLPFLFLRLRQGFGDSFQQFLSIQIVLASLVMIVPTLLLGTTFPMVARIYTQSLYRIGSSVGTAYASNTLGAIVGAFLGGFVLIPTIGVQNSIGLAVTITAAFGVLLVALDTRVRTGRRLAIAGAMFLVAVVAVLSFRTWDKKVMTSGVAIYVSSYASLPSDSLRLEFMERDELVYYKEGLTATISVHREAGSPYLYEKTNGKVDASFGDGPTQLMVGYLPMFLNPGAKRVLVIGMGSGMTAKAVAAFPVERLEVAEIEPAVIEGARYFAEKNGHIHDDPRVHFIHADGRNYLLAARTKYDVIISEPSNPWIAGIGNLFTREYYQEALSKLTEGGVFGQWMQTYGMAPEDLRMVYRTFAEVFPDVSLWFVNESDMVLTGSARPQRLRYAELQATLASRPIARQDFRELGFLDAYSLMAMYLMPKASLLTMASEAPFNLDDFPRLEFQAPRNLSRSTTYLNKHLTRAFAQPPVVEGADVERDPTGRLALALAQGYRVVRDRERAREWVDRSLQKSPMDAQAHLFRARLFAEDGQHHAAAEDLLRAVRGPVRLLEDAVEVAKTLDAQEAIQILRKIRQQDPRLLDAQAALADALQRAGQHRAAEAEYRELRGLRPRDPRVAFGLGQTLFSQGDYAAALPALDAAAILGEISGAFHAQRGETLMRLDRYAEAADAYRRALRTNVEYVTWRLNLAISLAAAGPPWHPEAKQRFREVLAMDPSNTRAWEELHKLGGRL